jgi:hypothetical protein
MKPYTTNDFQSAMSGLAPRIEELEYLQARLGPASELLAQHQPMAGVIYTERGPMDAADTVAAFSTGTVLYRFGTWVVTENGIACLTHHYPLTHARLQEHQDWASHLAEQTWVCLWDLLRALAVARMTGSSHHDHGPHGDSAHPS